MKARRFFAVTVGVLVLSAGLLLMADSALANDKDDKDRDSATGPSSVTQNWDKVLPAA